MSSLPGFGAGLQLQEDLLAHENGTGCFETLVFKLQTPGYNPEESI
jgi:hypothetical protein